MGLLDIDVSLAFDQYYSTDGQISLNLMSNNQFLSRSLIPLSSQVGAESPHWGVHFCSWAERWERLLRPTFPDRAMARGPGWMGMANSGCLADMAMTATDPLAI